jgi:hypothetical protein
MKRAVTPDSRVFAATANDSQHNPVSPCGHPLSARRDTQDLPKWTGSYGNDWEIAIYEMSGSFEACYFKRNAYHEHVTGYSIDEAHRLAVKRINALEGDGTSQD